MNMNSLRANGPRIFVGKKADFDRLERLGWNWVKPLSAPDTVKLLKDDKWEDYRKALASGAPFSTAFGSGGFPLGSGGGPLGSGGFPLGSGGGPLGSGGGVIGLGFHPDLPDSRDFVISTAQELPKPARDVLTAIAERNRKQSQQDKSKAKSHTKEGQAKLEPSLESKSKPPKFHDLRYTGHFSPIENQGSLGSCTAQATVGLVEYLMRSGSGVPDDMSRLFLYKTSRRLLGWQGDSGAYIRTAIKALRLFGIPPESSWPYIIEQFDAEPEAYHYSFAQNYKGMAYARLDGYGDSESDLLDKLRRCLFDGFPVVFGFPVYDSISLVGLDNNFVIPFPRPGDRQEGGHAVLAVGYDDEYPVEPAGQGGSQGALIIRNSWGAGWGEAGYAYLPYDYIKKEYATDFWTVFTQDWLKLEEE